MVVLGQNGAGKSTLLKTLAGLVSASEGTVEMPEGDRRLTVAVSAIELSLYPHLSLREHLTLTGALRGCPGREEELLDFIGLTHARDLMTTQISTGMKARLKLAMAIQARPLVLILDEPGAGLDEAGRELVVRVVAEQRTRGCVLLATNDPLERRLASLELQLAS